MSNLRDYYVRCLRTGLYASNRKRRPTWVCRDNAQRFQLWEARVLASDPALWAKGVPTVVHVSDDTVFTPAIRRDMTPRLVKAARV